MPISGFNEHSEMAAASEQYSIRAVGRSENPKEPAIYITSAKRLGGWVQKMAVVAYVHYWINADIVSGWVGRSEKVKTSADVI